MRIANSSLAVILAAILEPLAAHAEDGSFKPDIRATAYRQLR
jgi:hypothetical protein